MELSQGWVVKLGGGALVVLLIVVLMSWQLSKCGGRTGTMYVVVRHGDLVDIATLPGWGKPKIVCDTPGRRTDVTVGPGGAYIAFVEGEGSVTRLHVAKADCSEDHVVATNTTGPTRIVHPRFSPDGQWLSFLSLPDSEVYVVGRDGGRPIAISGGGAETLAVAWSPDSARLAFVSRRGGTREIYVVGRDGGGLAALTTKQNVVGEPGWSRDGTIAFGHVTLSAVNGATDVSRAIAVVSASGGEPRNLVEGSNAAIVAESPGLELVGPTFSPDGTWIAFYGSNVSPGLGTTVITTRAFLARSDGSSVHAVERGQIRCFAFASNSRLLVTVAGARSDAVMLFPLDGGEGDLVRTTDTCPVIAPAML